METEAKMPAFDEKGALACSECAGWRAVLFLLLWRSNTTWQESPPPAWT